MGTDKIDPKNVEQVVKGHIEAFKSKPQADDAESKAALFHKLNDALLGIVLHPEYDDEDRAWLAERFGADLDTSYIRNKYGHSTDKEG